MHLELATAPPRTPRPSSSPPALSIVVVNYRQWPQTWELVRQVRDSALVESGLVEVVVVDNHSPAHPLLGRLRRLEGVALRRWGRNRGFARAVNEGWRLSRGSWLLLLNPDVTLSPGFLEGVMHKVRELESEPRTGIVGFGLRDADGGRQGSTGPYPTLWSTMRGLLRPRDRRKYDLNQELGRRRVAWATGCCLLIRGACMADLGGLDRDFFLYYEDVDLCRRAQARGWTVWYEPALEVIHHSPLHRRRLTPLMRLVTRHALLLYAAKHWPAWQRRSLSGLVRLEAALHQLLGRDEAVAAELGGLACEMSQGRYNAAARRLARVLRSFDGALSPPAQPALANASFPPGQPCPDGVS